MGKLFKDVKIGDTLFVKRIVNGKTFVVLFKVHKISGRTNYIDFISKNGERSMSLPSNQDSYRSWYSSWFTDLQDCIKSFQKQSRYVINILSCNHKKIAFLDVDNNTLINKKWYPFTKESGFFNSHKYLFGIISDNQLHTIIDRSGTPLTTKWFTHITKNTKDGYLTGINTIVKTKVENDVTYTITCKEETKIVLPETLKLQSAKN